MCDHLIADVADPRRVAHAAAIQALQKSLGRIQFQYANSTLAFVALHAAWQAVRVAGYAVRYGQLTHLAELTQAVAWLTAIGEVAE